MEENNELNVWWRLIEYFRIHSEVTLLLLSSVIEDNFSI